MSDNVPDGLQRAMRQRLESLRRAGLTHLPRSSNRPPQPEAAVARPASSEAVPHAVETESSISRPSDGEMRPAPSPESQPDPSGTPSVKRTSRSAKSAPERQKQLSVLADQVAECTRCPELATTRTQTVFGVGNPQASILFLGEAPGADEDRQGEPFVGRAGQLLNKILEASRLQRAEVYICNVLRCRPPGNRNPTPDEATNCREYLDQQIETVDPDYIVCLGTVAAQALLGTTTPIGRLRGKFAEHGGAKVLCTYHPSYLLRNPAAKKDVWEDMKFLMRDMGVEI